MTTQLYRERQLWSGNERAKIRYVSGSSIAETSALSPGVSRHMYIVDLVFLKYKSLLYDFFTEIIKINARYCIRQYARKVFISTALGGS